ncbi:hypothetical protein FPE01S_01_09460 [Flavihumibacter petaseus NBRC 106054]|uniref:DUF7619 domain-containing protein n=2 Tax=Flavihumibacter TaxID=1004301 RepID=A0A0E9MWZ3_9BACT|nr:hypothetical protein FPE01S_01_09460 [Flavihumibacter petaseus NBRC 106054]
MSGKPAEKTVFVVKLNSTGTKIEWKLYYGARLEATPYDLRLGRNGNIYLLASTRSSDGDFASTVYEPVTNIIFTIDQRGNKISSKHIQGSNASWDHVFTSILPTKDEGFYVLGDFVVEKDSVVKNSMKPTLLRVDKNGDRLWSRQFANLPGDLGPDIRLLSMKYSEDSLSVLITGMHRPQIAMYANHLRALKTDTAGNIQWQKIIKSATGGQTVGRDIIPDGDGAIVVGTEERLYTGGDYDAILVKLGPVNAVTGTVFLDINGNGIRDNSEKGFDEAVVKIQNEATVTTTQPVDGKFYLETDSGGHRTSVNPYHKYYEVQPNEKIKVFHGFYEIDTVDFAVKPKPGQRDLGISIIPFTARVGFPARYTILGQNNGTDSITQGMIRFVKDSRISFSSADPIPHSIDGDTIAFYFNNLVPNQKLEISLTFQVPASLHIRDTLKLTAAILPIESDLTPSDNTVKLDQIITGSFDPNDKQDNFGGNMKRTAVAEGAYINYLVRFQNTGTDTAFTVRVADTLDNNLDWSSLQMIQASHRYRLSVKGGNKLEWVFDGINLPDSNRNEPLSHGYIAYRVKPKQDIMAGSAIRNTASIYFDFNEPVVTNTVVTKISTNQPGGIGGAAETELTMTVAPNPNHGQSNLLINGMLTGRFDIMVTDNLGRPVHQTSFTRDIPDLPQSVPLKIERFTPGIHYVSVYQKGKVWTWKVLLQ